MLGPETSQTRKATAGTRAHGLPHAERMLYQLSQVDPDHAVKGPHTDTQKPPKTKALAKKRSHLKRRPTQVAPLEPRRCQSRADSWSFLRPAAKLRPPRIQAAKLSAVQQYHSYQGIQLWRVSNYRRQICCAVCSARWSVQGHKDWCLVLRTGWAACETMSGTMSRRRPGAGTSAHGNRKHHSAEQASILAKRQKHDVSFSRFKSHHVWDLGGKSVAWVYHLKAVASEISGESSGPERTEAHWEAHGLFWPCPQTFDDDRSESLLHLHSATSKKSKFTASSRSRPAAWRPGAYVVSVTAGLHPARCPNHFFAVNEPLAVPWWWCDPFWCHELACGVTCGK